MGLFERGVGGKVFFGRHDLAPPYISSKLRLWLYHRAGGSYTILLYEEFYCTE